MAAWTFPNKLFNFRANGNLIAADLTDEISVISSNGIVSSVTASNYPIACNKFVGQGAADTVSAGPVTVGNFSFIDRNAAPTSGIEFAGNTAVVNTNAANPNIFEVLMPVAGGTYQVSVAFGTYTGTQNCYYDIWDGPNPTGVRISTGGPFGFTSVPANSYRGSLGNLVSTPASYAAWVATTDVITYTATDTGGAGSLPRLFIYMGDPAKAAAGNTTLSHLRIVQGAAAGPQLQLYYSQRRVLYFI